jgi:hypothetical protein
MKASKIIFPAACIILLAGCTFKSSTKKGISEMRVCNNANDGLCDEDMTAFKDEPATIYVSANLESPQDNKEILMKLNYANGDVRMVLDSQVLKLEGNETILYYSLNQPETGWLTGEYTVMFRSLKDTTITGQKTFTITPPLRFSGIWVDAFENVNRSSQPQDAVTQLPVSSGIIYMEAQLNDMIKGKTATVEWYNAANPDKPIASTPVKLDNMSIISGSITRPAKGFTSGEYEVRITLDDNSAAPVSRRFVLQ